MNELISFDYAIKYLLKDKGDHSVVEGFLSSLLACRGYGPVKVISLLDSESNKEERKAKRSVADLVVEDNQGNKYIVEIERNVKDSFVHKSLFNTSRLIVDNLAEREDYTDIKKIFHISLLYFKVGASAVHHGQTIVTEIDSNQRLTVHFTDQSTGKVFDAVDIMPEYFFISVPLFNDRIEKELDEWLYVMKHESAPPNFKSPYIEQLIKKLSILQMTSKEREEYSAHRRKIYNDRDELTKALEIGREKGIAEGLEQGKAEGLAEGVEKGREEGIEIGVEQRNIEVAINMLRQNLSTELIGQVTGLSDNDVLKLKNKM